MDATRDNPTQPDSRGLAAFAAGLAKLLAEEDTYSSNLVFSPLSIYAALSLLAAGAGGKTLDEILHVLGAQSRGDLEEFISRVAEDALKDRSGSGGPRVAFASGIWSDLTLLPKPAFREAVVGTYNGEASAVDFRNDPEAAREQINAWVAEATRNLITSVFDPGTIDQFTTLVLGSAMYFKGSWDEAFDRRSTMSKPFYRLDGGGTVDVPFMQSWDRQYIAVHDGFKVLKLRYKMQDDYFNHPTQLDDYSRPHDGVSDLYPTPWVYSDDHSPYGSAHASNHPYFSNLAPTPSSVGYNRTKFSMCIFLPDASDGLRGLVDMIASQPGFMHDHLPKKKIHVNQFQLPKFKLSFERNIITILRKLGLQLPFSLQADLSNMVEDDGSGMPIVLNEVIHKAVIEVNEEGTEAAAVSIMDMMFGGCSLIRPPSPPRVDFVADHSFAYFIVEEGTGALVFAGHVLDPSKEN